MDFSLRSTVLEHMDDPCLDKESYQKAYKDINRCNRLLGGNAITIQGVLDLLKRHPKKSYTIYDMGCGDGQMLRSLSKALDKQEVTYELVGIDLRDEVLDIAREASAAYPQIRYEQTDLMALKGGQHCDIVLCTLTMHHFEEEAIHAFTRQFADMARVGVVINDLQRSTWAYRLFQLFSLVFIRTEIAKDDGLISISKGFRQAELEDFAARLPECEHRIEWKWAFRYRWIFSPKSR
ncbi:MAG: methyltransferase domain-containing protein [Flavobacteriaceae bacterium]|nr:methyltransferase domain-containing protein [Flavobacteriaceae bacterium]